MRLVCPNCGAQYAVDERMIPPSGRDVQCSNCGNGWFQPPAGQDQDLADELGYELPNQETVSAPEPHQDTPGPDAIPTAPKRRKPDPEVMDVLREEAAREQAAREADARAPIETQPELDITQPEPIERPSIETPPPRDLPPSQLVDHSEEAQVAAAAALAGKAAARRDVFPDIEEINSTLEPNEAETNGENVSGPPLSIAKRRSGFRIGFGLVIVLAIVGLLGYAHAPRIAAALPGTEAPLRSYVDTINKGRIWLDRTLLEAVGKSETL